MLSMFRFLSRRKFNSFSSITSLSSETQSQENYGQKRWHSRHSYSRNYKFYNNIDNNDNDFEDNEKYDEKFDKKYDEKYDNSSHAFSECKYNLLTSRLLETFGWLGAAIVVGLNVEKQIFYGSKVSKRELKSNCSECSSRSISRICGECKHCFNFMSKLIAFASPLKNHNYVLKQIKDQFNSNKEGNKETQSQTHIQNKIDQNNCLRSSSSEISDHINEIPIESRNDPIDQICLELEKATIDYTEQLNNMLGISLIETDPEQAMQCWSNCKNSSKAIFNMGVAFETGKHSTNGTIDLMRAHQHYIISASMGHKLAIYNLSLFYLYGKGDIEVDLKRANTLLERAAELGVEQAKQFFDKLKSENDRIYKTDNYIEKPVMRTSASAPNLSDMSYPYFEYNISEKSNDSITTGN